MTVVAVIFTPVVLVYQAWSYWVFRKRIAVHHIPTTALAPRTSTTPAG
jgi:cytochrome d ubiquinol oxidase subunit II